MMTEDARESYTRLTSAADGKAKCGRDQTECARAVLHGKVNHVRRGLRLGDGLCITKKNSPRQKSRFRFSSFRGISHLFFERAAQG